MQWLYWQVSSFLDGSLDRGREELSQLVGGMASQRDMPGDLQEK